MGRSPKLLIFLADGISMSPGGLVPSIGDTSGLMQDALGDLCFLAKVMGTICGEFEKTFLVLREIGRRRKHSPPL